MSEEYPISNEEGEEDAPPPYESLQEAPPPPYSPSFLTSNRIFDIPEGPPDYFSLVSNRIHEARRDSTTSCGFVLKAMQTILFLFGIGVLLIILMSVPVAMLGVGAAYFNKCPIEPLIPIFMIIFGLCGIMKSIETLIKHIVACFKYSCLKRCFERWRQHSRLKYLFVVWRILDVIFNLLLFGWFIAGSYWIFHVYGELQDSDFNRSLCHPVLYKFAFGMMISSYIIVGLTCCCVCGCGLCQNPVTGEDERRSRREENDHNDNYNNLQNGSSNRIESIDMVNPSSTSVNQDHDSLHETDSPTEQESF